MDPSGSKKKEVTLLGRAQGPQITYGAAWNREKELVRRLQLQIETLNHKNKEMSSELRDEKCRRTSAEKQRDTSACRVAKLEEKLTILQASFEDMKSQAERWHRTSIDLEKEKRNLELEKERLQDELVRSSKRAEGLEFQCAENQIALGRANQELDETHEELARSQDVSEQQKENIDLFKKKIAILNHAKDSKDARNHHLLKEKQRLFQKLTVARNRIAKVDRFARGKTARASSADVAETLGRLKSFSIFTSVAVNTKKQLSSGGFETPEKCFSELEHDNNPSKKRFSKTRSEVSRLYSALDDERMEREKLLKENREFQMKIFNLQTRLRNSSRR
mmetsp:Transcript_32063/g.54306  ORF Transcript_32063/g.54306 Transcript_32063/m.54306 type:complete len:335 (-) Transcript_32063:121-1125(-)